MADAKSLAEHRAALAEANGKEQVTDEPEAGTSLDDMPEDNEPQFEFEIPDTGRTVNIGTVIPKNTPTEVKYKMSGKSIDAIRGGMLDPADTTGLALVSYVVEDIDVKFTRDADRVITKAVVYFTLAPRHIVNARSEEGGMLLSGQEAVAA